MNVYGSCGSNGIIRLGGLLRYSRGRWVEGFSSNDGHGDALLAGLFGVYLGLALTITNFVSSVICQSYSEDVITMLKQRNNHRFHKYASLLGRITTLIDAIPMYKIFHVLREDNVSADFLAKHDRLSRLGLIVWSAPPNDLKDLLLREAPN